jgi:predicted metallopeptidase
VNGFDFTHHIARVCTDMAARLDDLRHIDMSLVAVSFRQTRKRMRGGLYASLTPLRFTGGQTESVRRGRNWRIQRVVLDGREMLYLLNFYLPRFLDLPLPEKLTTIAHELLHVGPRFDGDLRRFGGRCYAHTHSHAEFDAQAAKLAQRWLALGPDNDLYAFLRLDFMKLQAVHGRIYGRRIAAPKLIPTQ